MHLFTWYKNPALLKHFYNSDAMRAPFTEKELWSDEPFWLAATSSHGPPPSFKVCGTLPREGAGTLSFLGWVWVCVHCSLGFGLDAVHLFGVLSQS